MGVCVVCVLPETCVFNDSPVASGLCWIPATCSALLQALSGLFFLFWAVLV